MTRCRQPLLTHRYTNTCILHPGLPPIKFCTNSPLLNWCWFGRSMELQYRVWYYKMWKMCIGMCICFTYLIQKHLPTYMYIWQFLHISIMTIAKYSTLGTMNILVSIKTINLIYLVAYLIGQWFLLLFVSGYMPQDRWFAESAFLAPAFCELW